MRPDKKLAALLGLSTLPNTLSNGYLLVDAGTPRRQGSHQTIQFHGTADIWALNGATSVAAFPPALPRRRRIRR